MPKKISLFLLLLFPPIFCFPQQINRYKNKERHGKWIIYSDSTQTHIDNMGRYRKGTPKGIWNYYDEKGNLIKKEKFRFKKIYTTFYYSNGKVWQQGKAKNREEGKLLHFYFYGNWFVYDTLGRLIAKQVYKMGEKISEVNYKTSSEKGINDSLDLALKAIDGQMRFYFDTIRIAEKAFGKNSIQYQRAVSLNTLHTSKLLSDLDKLILTYGYPGKTLVGQDYSLAFSIISSANTSYKEKYLQLVIDAANKNELDWRDVAYFVDKVKVAKKEKQVYCTQYKYDEKQKKIYYYPVEEINNLNVRRKKVGLDEITISTLNFIDY